MALPPVALSDHHRSPFDEVVLIIDGREENTITIACESSLEIADELIRWVNNQEQIITALTAAELALSAVESGKSAPELLRSIGALCKQLKELTGAAA
ncbi:hypothetical protein [Bradyrhizobium sp. 188]|uniref:hypothetical protein n=1 Tax=Bradyrhizobium sp. 188 TaxID=2782656 RepID=UPI001FF980E2|nr:hypothetical protein [Bradyrhizobium sp. 188]MCK1501532.1 hypothetical protein [Bradyrhizobium sp. 188]